jgi:predicted ATPase/Tfp pilus assembly protein PilF
LKLVRGSKFLATSRVSLSVRSEHTFIVRPLELPGLRDRSSREDLLASSAVQLFIERAKAVKGDFEIDDESLRAVAQICSHLDGLPLAIELAAARVKLLSPQVLLGRLVDPDGRISLQLLTGGAHDLPARQQTIRDTIGWSYSLLDADCKNLFCCLSVFAGGCTLLTAEAVCYEISERDIDVVDGIASLIDCNLLRQTNQTTGESRIEMLQTIREFGLEQLRKSRIEAKIFRAYATYFACFTEKAEANRRGPEYINWAERIETEYDNFKASLNWAFQNEPELAARITASIGEFWFGQGHWTDLRVACETALNRTGKASLGGEVRCARFAGQCARVTGDPVRAKKFFEQSLSLSEKSPDQLQIIETLNELGSVLFHNEGRNAEARTLFERALNIAKELNDENRLADTIFELGDLSLTECDFEDAREKFEQAAAICRKHAYVVGTAQCTSYLAAVAIELGEYERASSYLKQALQIHENAREAHNAIWDRYKRGQIACARGEFGHAEVEFEECCKAFQQMSATVGEAWSVYELGKISLYKEDLAEANTFFERSLAMFRSLGRPTAWAALQLGTTAIYEGRFRSARKSLEKGLAVFRESGVKNGIVDTLCQLARLARLQSDYAAAHSFLSESMELVREMDSKRLAAPVLEQLAYVANVEKRYDCGAKLLGKIDALRGEMGSPVPPCDRTEHHAANETARMELGDQVFDTVWTEGKTLRLDQVDL